MGCLSGKAQTIVWQGPARRVLRPLFPALACVSALLVLGRLHGEAALGRVFLGPLTRRGYIFEALKLIQPPPPRPPNSTPSTDSALTGREPAASCACCFRYWPAFLPGARCVWVWVYNLRRSPLS
jgi:hypothetical protein